MTAGQSPRTHAYPTAQVEVPATATDPVSRNGVRAACQVAPPLRVKNRPGSYAHPCCADTNARPACAPGWCWPLAIRLAVQLTPPSAVRSIHDRSVVLVPAYPEIAAKPMPRPGKAM